MDGIAYLLIALITALGSAGAWKFYNDWRRDRREDAAHYSKFIKEDYRERLDSVEEQLRDAVEEKEQLWERVLQLTKEISELNMKVKFLEQENEKLKSELLIERRRGGD